MGDYIRWIRNQVGRELILLNFAAACIADAQGRLLLQRRRDKDAWGFPGGAIELGESADEAVVREVAEETGLKVAVTGLLGVYTKYFDAYPNGDRAQTIAIFFICSIIGGELCADDDESLELRFFAPATAPALFNQQHQDALADFVSGSRGVYR